jgi:multiple sugar transport system ATP-binding protein
VASVELKNLWKKFGAVIAVENISWKCEHGEFFSILGPSGCGKSSTLRMIAGLEEITAGEIYIGDRLVNDLSPKERNVAMVFETWALYPNLTVHENIAFPLRIRKLPKSEIDQKVRWAANFLDLEDVLNSYVLGLSGGQKQRVSIGRAIVRQPAVLLMDEPISHLDAALRARMKSELQEMVRNLHVTTIYITHDQMESMAMADRIAVMNEGRILQIGSATEIYERPRTEFVAQFIGEPPMNFANCNLVEENGRRFLASPSFRIEASAELGKQIVSYQGPPEMKLGIRPESVSVDTSLRKSGISAVVDFVEPQGERTILSVKLADGEIFLIDVAPEIRPNIGENVHLSFDLEQAHFFDAQTGINIRYH